jgi:hypothetical protein
MLGKILVPLQEASPVTTLQATTSLHELLEEHPFLVDFLSDYKPAFAILRNRVMRATVGRAATLGRVAEMGGVPLETLVADLEREIGRRHGGAGAATPTSAVSAGTRPERTAGLKSLILDLHDGLEPAVARARFDDLVRDVSPGEIGAMEEALIKDGMPVQEIQRLCDLHVAMVRGSLDRQEETTAPAGHPVHTYRAANEVITRLANHLGETAARMAAGGSATPPETAALLAELAGVHNHYLRKENQLFPFLERHGITGPSQVMWGVHDEIRAQLKEAREAVEGGGAPAGVAAAGIGGGSPARRPVSVGGEAPPAGPDAATRLAALARSVVEMVYKENKILFPLALQTLSVQEWAQVRRGEDEMGYAFAEPAAAWPPVGSPLASAGGAAPTGGHATPPAAGAGLRLPIVSRQATEPLPPIPASASAPTNGYLELGTGQLTLEQVDMILRVLPVDLSFVDADGFVRYYSETAERIFPRTPGAIGRHVENCHPPKSVHMVKGILRAFAAGEKDVAEFWIEMQGKFIHIRYYAVRNPGKEYLGCLEVTQDVTGIRALEGQRRLLEWS